MRGVDVKVHAASAGRAEAKRTKLTTRDAARDARVEGVLPTVGDVCVGFLEQSTEAADKTEAAACNTSQVAAQRIIRAAAQATGHVSDASYLRAGVRLVQAAAATSTLANAIPKQLQPSSCQESLRKRRERAIGEFL